MRNHCPFVTSFSRSVSMELLFTTLGRGERGVREFMRRASFINSFVLEARLRVLYDDEITLGLIMN